MVDNHGTAWGESWQPAMSPRSPGDILCVCSSMVERWREVPEVVGSTPTGYTFNALSARGRLSGPEPDNIRSNRIEASLCVLSVSGSTSGF